MSDGKGKVVWGFDGRWYYGSIEEKTVRNGGGYEVFRNRVGEVLELRPYDKHKTIDVTATVTSDVGDDEIPEVGDTFTAPYAGTETQFCCTGSSLTSRNEDTATLRMTGRMLPGVTPSAHVSDESAEAADAETTEEAETAAPVK